MLVLTRKQNEKIQIGNEIVITILRMKGKGVRLGIQAPPEVSVLRGELAFEIADEMESSHETDAPVGKSTKATSLRTLAKSAAGYETAASWSI
jgi:carbon storage regulator